jgi:hypothetical protein
LARQHASIQKHRLYHGHSRQLHGLPCLGKHLCVCILLEDASNIDNCANRLSQQWCYECMVISTIVLPMQHTPQTYIQIRWNCTSSHALMKPTNSSTSTD